jgi:hypothetical protein
LLSRLDKISF